jgi:hypothetical protein
LHISYLHLYFHISIHFKKLVVTFFFWQDGTIQMDPIVSTEKNWTRRKTSILISYLQVRQTWNRGLRSGVNKINVNLKVSIEFQGAMFYIYINFETFLRSYIVKKTLLPRCSQCTLNKPIHHKLLHLETVYLWFLTDKINHE